MSLRPTPQQAQLNPLSGLVASKSKWEKLAHFSLGLIFPPRCIGCDRVDYGWCPDCQEALKQQDIIPQTQKTSQGLAIVSTARHAGLLMQAIHAFKYHDVPDLYTTLSHRLAVCLQRWNITPDFIIPVPLHPHRERTRGYNQSALLTAGVSQLTGIPYQLDLLTRTIATTPQVGLNQHDRVNNLTGAFHAEPIDGLSLLLIDDVTTTGTTLTHCARTLKQAGASRIYGLTVTCT